MLASTEKLLEKGFGDKIFKQWSFSSVFNGTPVSRYALMNRALMKGEIVRLSRGNYILGEKYRSKSISKFSIACQMILGSFISFETALSFHGWIPEKVNLVMSNISKGRTRSFNTVFGEFKYMKVLVNEYKSLSAVLRKEIDGNLFLIASPLRALADIVYIQKIEWINLDFLTDGLRIEMENLESLTSKDFDEISSVYCRKNVLVFLKKLRTVLEK